MRWVVTLVGVQLLCIIVWVLGPLLTELDPWPARLAAIMGLLLLWAAANLLLDLRDARRDAALAQGAAGGEAGALSARLAEALALMRKLKGRSFHLHEQPWYAIIGPPGAGKTTALLNAGLEFPLAAQLGPGAVAGVGGTRLCDWWFTGDAVLIDTAGRYTTQDSNQAADRAGWDAFLALLRRTRPRQPLNGVIVAIALNDVAGDPALLQAHARAIRARLDELEQRLGVRMPVYALFTKADLLIGFSEYFDDLDRTGREQAWGATFRLDETPDAAALRPLLDRLDRRVFQRLDAEPNPDRRALIAGFPAQLASVLTPLQAFVASAFGPDDAGHSPMLRGMYMASGTQEGTPIDRLIGALSRSFGLDQRRAASLRPEAGRAYFLAAILRDVVFREAMLVSHDPGAARRRRVVRVAGFAACAVLALAGVGFVWWEQGPPQTAIAQAQAAMAGQQALAANLVFDPVSDDDVAALVPWLDAMLPKPAPQPGLIGFSQDDKLAAANRAQYRRALDYALLPRLVWRAETQVRGLLGQSDPLYEATRIYLMLGGGGPLDRALVQDWFARDWTATLSGATQASLARHLAALMQEPLPPVPLDGPLVARARETIGRVSLAARAWSRLKPLAAHAAAPWRPADALGPAGARVFIRLSGRALEDGIPGLYTLDGFRNGVRPALARAAEAAAAEGWVFGEAIEPDSPRRRTLEADMLALYAAEYAAVWEAMLTDLDPAPLRSLTQAAQDLYILASAYSPIRAVLASAAAQLAPAAAGDAPALAAIDQRFQPLRTLLSGAAAPINAVLRPLGDLQQQLAKQAASTTRQPAPSLDTDPAAALRAEAIRQPQPLARWLVALATTGASLRDGGARGAMIDAWNANGGPGALCPAVVARYPFTPAATADASLDDVTRLLGPGGAMDAFLNGQLKPYVDTGTRPWKLQPVEGVSAPLTAADLARFQQAAAIRELLFPAGSTQMLVRFDLTPGPLEPGTTAVTLEVGATAVTATPDAPARPSAITWPGRPRATSARLAVEGAEPFKIETQGAWAAFRLLATAKPTQAGGRTTLVFTGNGRTARFDLRATPNPFGSPLLAEFRCPAVQ